MVQVVCFSECFSVLVLAKIDMQWHFRLSFHETIYYTHARRHVQCSITALAVCSVFFGSLVYKEYIATKQLQCKCLQQVYTVGISTIS